MNAGVKESPQTVPDRTRFKKFPLRELREHPENIQTKEVETLIRDHPEELLKHHVPAANPEQILAAANQVQIRNWSGIHPENLKKLLCFHKTSRKQNPKFLAELLHETSSRI